jgi:2-polyprenyl-6-methoxyphenol hydroxylase-like FAD-dependent oxidoreductase
MAASSAKKVMIVGAGIGGPVLGMALCERGIEAKLVEARPASALAEGAFLGLAPNGMHALSELDLAGRVQQLGHACTAFRFSNRKSKTLGAIDRSADASRFGYALTMVRRSDLHALLTEEAERRGVAIERGKRLIALDAENGVARFADGTDSQADIVVGCDGLRSTVRSLVFPGSPRPRFSELFDYGGFAPVVPSNLTPGVNEMVFGRRAFFGAFATLRGETFWFHNGPPAQAKSEDEASRERLLALHADDPPWIAELLRATPEVLGPWPLFELEPLPAWSRERVVLLGDAAHAMSPSAGQGASLAIEDALVLARSLAVEPNRASALASYERARRPRVERIAKVARRSSNGKVPSSSFAEAVRDFVLPFFLRLGGAAQEREYAYRVDAPYALGT